MNDSGSLATTGLSLAVYPALVTAGNVAIAPNHVGGYLRLLLEKVVVGRDAIRISGPKKQAAWTCRRPGG